MKFQTKPEIAAEMIRRTSAAGKVQFDWIIADELYGDSGEFHGCVGSDAAALLAGGEEEHVGVDGRSGHAAGQDAGAEEAAESLGSYRYREVRSVEEMAPTCRPEAWRPLKLREGAKGPLVFEFAVLRVWAMRHNRPGPPIWLVLRRSLDETSEVKCYVSNASEETPWEQLAMVTGTRIRVEEYFEDGKMHLGHGGLRGASVEQLASSHGPGGAGPLVRDVDETGLEKGRSRVDVGHGLAIAAIGVRPSAAGHRTTQFIWSNITSQRNRAAHNSHRKSWLQKHKRLKPEVLL